LLRYTLHCEGSVDSQFLCGRLGWLELIAKPPSLDSKSNWEPTSEEWESMSCLRFQYETASLEALLAVHSRGSQVVVSDAPTDRSDLCRLNRLNELSPAMTLSGMRRLIDSDKSPAFSLLVPHPCSCTRGRSVGAFSSVRRAGSLRIANGHAGRRMSGFTRGRWDSEGRTSRLSVPVCKVAA
jgi:hypothetical protein